VIAESKGINSNRVGVETGGSSPERVQVPPAPAKPNWKDIERCPIWKVLGIIECNNCDTRVYCWGTESELPE